MKRIFLTLFAAVICSVLFAQRYSDFVAPNANGARSIADSIVAYSKSHFVYLPPRPTTPDNYIYVVAYDASKIEMTVFFKIKGTDIREYVFDHVGGNFMDLFPFWKRFIDKTADENALLNANHKNFKKALTFEAGKQLVYWFRQTSPDIWEIRRYVIL